MDAKSNPANAAPPATPKNETESSKAMRTQTNTEMQGILQQQLAALQRNNRCIEQHLNACEMMNSETTQINPTSPNQKMSRFCDQLIQRIQCIRQMEAGTPKKVDIVEDTQSHLDVCSRAAAYCQTCFRAGRRPVKKIEEPCQSPSNTNESNEYFRVDLVLSDERQVESRRVRNRNTRSTSSDRASPRRLPMWGMRTARAYTPTPTPHRPWRRRPGSAYPVGHPPSPMPSTRVRSTPNAFRTPRDTQEDFRLAMALQAAELERLRAHRRAGRRNDQQNENRQRR